MKAFIFYGGWDGHHPQELACFIRKLLADDGCEVVVEDHLSKLNSLESLLEFDLIVPIWTMGVLSSEQERNLACAIEKGVGMAGFHGGMGDAFRSNNLFQFVVGGQFVHHPEGAFDFDIEISDATDPILKDIGPFSVHAEQYYMHVDVSNHLLLHTKLRGNEYPNIHSKGILMPVCWKRLYGDGRVFYLSIGHHLNEFNKELLTILLRGVRWAANTE